MRPDIIALLRSSDRAFVRQLIGMDPVAMFRWGILRATIRGLAAFNEAGRSWAAKTAGASSNKINFSFFFFLFIIDKCLIISSGRQWCVRLNKYGTITSYSCRCTTASESCSVISRRGSVEKCGASELEVFRDLEIFLCVPEAFRGFGRSDPFL